MCCSCLLCFAAKDLVALSLHSLKLATSLRLERRPHQIADAQTREVTENAS